MRVSLVVQFGPDAGRTLNVPAGTAVVVGRKLPAEFIVEGDLTLSRTHFALACNPPLVSIRDLGSTSGTLLNGTPVEQSLLSDGDVIQAGSSRFFVRIDARARSEIATSPPGTPLPAQSDRDGPATEEVSTITGDSLHDRVLKQLRAQKEPLYAILDAARDPLVLLRLMDSKEQYQSLYEGPKGERLAAAAPYLVSLPPSTSFLETLVREGWGNSWGVYLNCNEPFAEVRKQLRRFLIVELAEQGKVYFRYYDPRVLRVVLPTFTPGERSEFFGPILRFILEGESTADPLEFPGERGEVERRAETPGRLNQQVDPTRR